MQRILPYLIVFGVIGIVVGVTIIASSASIPADSANVRDYVRGNALIAIRLPLTKGADGIITVTRDRRIIGRDSRYQHAPIPQDVFDALMQFRAAWCEQESQASFSAPTSAYVVGLECSGYGKQYAFAKEQVPAILQWILDREKGG